MFNYNEFKAAMQEKGHTVKKSGKYITVIPYNGDKGFLYARDVISGFEDFLTVLWYDHYNTTIYKVRCKIK